MKISKGFRLWHLVRPIYVLNDIVGSFAVWFIVTIVGNMFTILTGYGVYVTWRGRIFSFREDDYLQKFPNIEINKNGDFITPRFVAGIIWAIIAIVFLGCQFGWIVLGIPGMFVIAIIGDYIDDKEFAAECRELEKQLRLSAQAIRDEFEEKQ